jgi:type I restriction enzyme R subunit
MSNGDKNSSERAFQENFVKELEKYKWKSPDFLNGNKKKVTVSDLINHWRSELNRINADQLEGVELTDNEFKQVMTKVGQISNSYEAAKILSIEESKGKIDGIYRDDNPNITRKQITLTIFKKAEVRGGDSSYRVAREVVTSNNNRFDIVLLINGLPLINIEQKRTDKSLDEAYGQFIRYYRDGEYCNNFMVFSQMMVISTEIETRYFATPKSVDEFNPSFVFHWSDKENKPINNWQKVVEHFLMIPMAHQMVGDYLVIDEAKEEENRRHMIMRPYQVYALQAIEGAAFGWNNDGVAQGGFVWHTTGSGKTITSFKTALFLSTRAGFDKVVFLVDRRELDKRTSENFEAYAAYESVSVDNTEHTYQLKKQLESVKAGIVVTTTFKLNFLVKELEDKQDKRLADKKIVFIIDEAHRTTMGQMMGTIKNFFKNNGLFYGFTGTPLFDENKIKGKVNEKSEVINTTEKLFGPNLHEYTIDEAISDGNVLGFHVDYINTGEFKSYDDLRDQLVDNIKKEKPELSEREVERLVQGWSEAEVELQSKERKILLYQDETHIPRVVEEILSNWESQSQCGEFNAILTVAYKKRVIAYYDEFKKQISERGVTLNVAMTFSFGNENENDPYNVPLKIIKGMFKDYAEFTGIEFIAGDKKHGEDAYFEDVVERATRGGSGRNPKNIDLVIVADQLLTGYDSKRLNTLYVDRSLELQGLIQAYSRTNRVFGNTKEFGTIVNFQYPRLTEKNVNIALKLYGSGGKSSKAIVDTYVTAVQKLAIKNVEMIKSLPDPTEWATIKDNKDKKEAFILAFKDVAEQLNLVEQYYVFKWDDIAFGINEHMWLKYVGAYKNLTHKPGTPLPATPINSLVGKTKLAGTQVIDAAHILGLIGSKVSTAGGIQRVDSETLRIIYEQIQELSNMGDDVQAQLLKEFVDTKLVPGNLSSDLNFDESFEVWKKDKQAVVVEGFAQEWGLDTELLLESVVAYSTSQPDIVPYREELTNSVDFNRATNKSAGDRLKHYMILNRELPKWIVEIKQKYS